MPFSLSRSPATPDHGDRIRRFLSGGHPPRRIMVTAVALFFLAVTRQAGLR